MIIKIGSDNIHLQYNKKKRKKKRKKFSLGWELLKWLYPNTDDGSFGQLAKVVSSRRKNILFCSKGHYLED